MRSAYLTLIVGFAALGFIGCSAAQQATWAQTHTLDKIEKEAAPAIPAVISAATGNFSPLVDFLSKFIPFMIGGTTGVAGHALVKTARRAGKQERQSDRRLTTPPPAGAPPPPGASADTISEGNRLLSLRKAAA